MVIQGHIMIIQYAIISKNNYKAKKIHGACATILCFSTLYNEPKCIEIHKKMTKFMVILTDDPLAAAHHNPDHPELPHHRPLPQDRHEAGGAQDGRQAQARTRLHRR